MIVPVRPSLPDATLNQYCSVWPCPAVCAVADRVGVSVATVVRSVGRALVGSTPDGGTRVVNDRTGEVCVLVPP